ncbi:hypothetical protein CAOG_08737, partial [Capsaspora owczarzaki ATCC 30864]|uniref:hypothetical protein n=1 Tax=Capsaspora owczarzaki (strain ATCC 30864) TaxID=595528 RepID=UPI0003522095
MSEHEEIKSVADLLKRPAGTLLHAKQHLVEITATTTVVDTLKVLARHNILAVPVYDEEKKEYVGIVHTFDLLVYISFGFFQVEEKVTPESLQVHIDKLRNLPAQELIGIAHLSKAGWWHNGLNVYEPTRSIAEILSPLEGGLERVLVRATPTHRPEGPSDEMHEGHYSALRILSQSDVLRFILTHPRATQELTNKTLGQLGLTSNFNEFQKIVSVRESESALEGFRHMYTQGADAVA